MRIKGNCGFILDGMKVRVLGKMKGEIELQTLDVIGLILQENLFPIKHGEISHFLFYFKLIFSQSLRTYLLYQILCMF